MLLIGLKTFVGTWAGAGSSLFGGWLSGFDLAALATGGLGGWLLFHHPHFVRSALLFPWLQRLAAPGIAFLLLFGYLVQGNLLLPVLYTLFFVNLVSSPYRVNLEGRGWNYLGIRSFGLYMYHPLAIGLSLWLVEGLIGFHDWRMGQNLALYGLSAFLTCAFAVVSYRFFEGPLLRLKERVGGISRTEVKGGEIRYRPAA